MAYYQYYQQHNPSNWGTSQYQFVKPPAPAYQPQPSWRGEEYYRAHGGEDDSFFGSIWNRVRGITGARGFKRAVAKDWQRRVYSGQIDVTKLGPSELGAAAGYEAIRIWETHKGIYQLPLSSDADREREALAGIAVAEANKLWGYATTYVKRHGRTECCEIAAATAERIFNRDYDKDEYHRSRSRSRSIYGGDSPHHRSSSRLGSHAGSYHSDPYHGDVYHSEPRVIDRYTSSTTTEDPYYADPYASSHSSHKHKHKHRRSSSASYYPPATSIVSHSPHHQTYALPPSPHHQTYGLPPSPRMGHSTVQPTYIPASPHTTYISSHSPQPTYATLPQQQPHYIFPKTSDSYGAPGTSAPSAYPISSHPQVQYVMPQASQGVQYVYPQGSTYGGSGGNPLPQPPMIINSVGDPYRRRRAHSHSYPIAPDYTY